jgi:hypothetical protein
MNATGKPALLIAAAAALFAGCQGAPPERSLKTSNPAYTVDRLFTDPAGNTVYKFVDDGESRYYVVGPNHPQMLQPPKKRDEVGAPDDISNDILQRASEAAGGHTGRSK